MLIADHLASLPLKCLRGLWMSLSKKLTLLKCRLFVRKTLDGNLIFIGFFAEYSKSSEKTDGNTI